jgi:MerR family transcriptional regulator, heat shock protein HspR
VEVQVSDNGATLEPLYYISVVARMVNIHPQTLRNYERLGLVCPTRTDGNVRLYSDQDIERVRKICRLSDELGVNLAGIEIVLNLLDRVEQLQQEMGEVRAQYEDKIAYLRQCLGELEVNRSESRSRVVENDDLSKRRPTC